MNLKSKSLYKGFERMNRAGIILFFFIVIFSSFFFTGCKKDFSGNVLLPEIDTTSGNKTKPNIVLIIADDIGFEVPGFNGGDSYNTQNLNYLAKNGVKFLQCYSHPNDFPSRLALLTGKYNFRNYQQWGQLPLGEKTIGNMLQDAGYQTCYAGKWESDGGDVGIKAAGFEKYRVFQPFLSSNGRIGKYKNPVIYENGDYLPSSATLNKFSDDLFTDYLTDFIDSNKNKPFFAIYAPVLASSPWVPTPINTDFSNWDPANDYVNSNTKYFPDMVKYLDLMEGRIFDKLRNLGLINNTVIMFTSVNGSSRQIYSVYKGDSVQGGKYLTSTRGTHAPFVLYWPGKIPIKQKNTSTLIDFTDFLPTLADMAGIAAPTNYGTLDGVSFFDNMFGTIGKDRDWVFCHWDDTLNDAKPPVRYVNSKFYKLYDSPDYSGFYNILADPEEQSPYPDAILSPTELAIKNEFEIVLKTLK